jgi:hypothetical protein
VVAIKHDREFVRLRRHERIQMRVVQVRGSAAGISNRSDGCGQVAALLLEFVDRDVCRFFDCSALTRLKQNLVEILQQRTECRRKRPLGIMQNFRQDRRRPGAKLGRQEQRREEEEANALCTFVAKNRRAHGTAIVQ